MRARDEFLKPTAPDFFCFNIRSWAFSHNEQSISLIGQFIELVTLYRIPPWLASYGSLQGAIKSAGHGDARDVPARSTLTARNHSQVSNAHVGSGLLRAGPSRAR